MTEDEMVGWHHQLNGILITQWLMIILFFGPEGHMSYRLTPHIVFHSWLKVLIKLACIQFRHLHLGAVLVP